MESAAFFDRQNLLALCDAYDLTSRLPKGWVQLAYIDPPLFANTGFEEPQAQIESIRNHLLGLGRVLQQIRRSLAETGNLFLHSVPQMNGSVRLLLDQIFGRDNFRQEIVLPRFTRNLSDIRLGHDTIFHFSVGTKSIFNPQARRFTSAEIASKSHRSDERGPYRLESLTIPILRPGFTFVWQGVAPPPHRSWRYSIERLNEMLKDGRIELSSDQKLPLMKRYLDEQAGVDVGSVWDDLTLRLSPAENVHFPSQKPVRVLERIIQMGSLEGNVVLDPFCGSGTTMVVAQKLNRQWIGGDNNKEAIVIAKRRLKSECGLHLEENFLFVDSEVLRTSVREESLEHLEVSTGFENMFEAKVEQFILGQRLKIEETREYEFKEVTSRRPYDSIANTADEYAVAFLNSSGGRIFWGVRDNDCVVTGVRLNAQERNRLRQVVTSKLTAIRPPLDPTSYRLVIHPVAQSASDPDLVVVELIVPRVFAGNPFYTGGNEAFVRLDGVTQKLQGPALTEWIKRRIQSQ